MIPLAHSARPDKGIPAQTYAAHIGRVFARAASNAAKAGAQAPAIDNLLRAAVRFAALFHDLGKLDPANQSVLASTGGGRLPITHWDAGVAHLFGNLAPPDLARQLASAVIYAHHRGLPAFLAEEQKGGDCFRELTKQPDGRPLRQLTDQRLSQYLVAHQAALPALIVDECVPTVSGIPPLLVRLALSCLVDADHADTASHYGNPVPNHEPPLRATERLQALDAYVQGLAVGKSDEKTLLRSAVYSACRNADTTAALVECDSPVGSGKTTAVMAHLLQAACAKGLRRLFVVLPFTNIIDQSVETYRKCLLLPDERPEDIVAAHHHRAEYADPLTRQFSALWHAPVVVTTAVQFFETLASNHPAAVRKLHQLAGAGVFIDESHACLPAKLWPQSWDWLTQLARDWGCHFVLGSGSLNRLWRLREVVPQPIDLPSLVQTEVRTQTAEAEERRIIYRTRTEVQTLEQLAAWLLELPGPRLVIVNTVQTAAAVARLLAEKRKRHGVEHLSTALTPQDRGGTLQRIRKRLTDKNDTNWTLVATSCVEAGVDISFRTGLRERASLTSLIQVGGRVNRSNEYGSGDVWDFQLQCVGLVRENPGYRDSARVLGAHFQEAKVKPEFCTEALRRELQLLGTAELNKQLREAEGVLDFPKVEELYKVIDQPTVTVIVDPGLQRQLDAGFPVDWRLIQQGSVQIYTSKVLEFGVRDFAHFPGVKGWTLVYDSFLGYMAGVLPLVDAHLAAFIV
jgi:CRISPR-associated endonuclease/helicase Cas3